MARSKIRQKQDAERERIARYDAQLRAPRARTGLDLDAIARSILAGLKQRAIRDMRDWVPRIKSKDPGKIALAYARRAYALYPAPPHLERVWLGGEDLEATEQLRRKRWYVEVVQGRSLYKTVTRGFLTKRETHVFLNPPVQFGFTEALWHAVARSYTDDFGTVLRVARSKVARQEVTPFWRDAARFFAVSSAPLDEIDDLCDYFEARRARDAGYSLSGRTLGSLRNQMAEWHRDLMRARRIGGGSWPGAGLPDWCWKDDNHAPPHKQVTWTVKQIKTGNDLAEEGARMRHCVAFYKQRCMRGSCSIWSLRRKTRAKEERVLTLEMNAANDIVQVRGFANRLANPDELRILGRWASENGIRRF
jgi:hypothetical protein